MARVAVAAGLDPREVADQTVTAIRERRFFVLPHYEEACEALAIGSRGCEPTSRPRFAAPRQGEVVDACTPSRARRPYLCVERTPVEATCPECGATELAGVPRARRRRLVGRAQVPGAASHSVSREPAPLLGSYVPLGLRIMRERR